MRLARPLAYPSGLPGQPDTMKKCSGLMPYPEPSVRDFLRIYRVLMLATLARYRLKAKSALRELRAILFYHTVKREGEMKCTICRREIYLSGAGHWYHYELRDLGHIAAPESPKSGQLGLPETDATRKPDSAPN